jgi:hypothetical protein
MPAFACRGLTELPTRLLFGQKKWQAKGISKKEISSTLNFLLLTSAD